MTTTIKIDRKSIHKNPKVGNTKMHIAGATEINFSYNKISLDDLKIIENLERGGMGVFILQWGIKPVLSGHDSIGGVCLHDEALLLLPKNGLKYEIKNNAHTVHHEPEPTWFYKYKPTKVKCSECKKLISDNKIISAWDDDGIPYDLCPNCSGINTFDIKYEDINEAIDSL